MRRRRIRLEALESRMVMSAMSLIDSAGENYSDDDRDHLDPYGNEYHVLPEAVGQWEGSTRDDGTGSTSSAASLDQTFFLHSNPGAAHTIFLDFDGHTTSGTYWNSSFNDGKDIVTPAYSFTGDSSFADSELSRIQAIWERVAEDFQPFDVNVTTEQPAIDALEKSGSSDAAWGVRVVIGGDGTWYGSGGGVAYVGSFTWSSDTPVFAFEDNLGNGNEKYTAEAISHEAGHALGLSHDGRTSPSEAYYAGHGSGETGWAPIMGNSYYKSLTQWSRSEYAYANNTEDDLAIITGNNGFGYRADDHGDRLASATPLIDNSGSISSSGLIERNDDYDLFSFSTDAGAIRFDFEPFYRGPNLDIAASLLDAAGNVLVASNPIGKLAATVSASVAAGEYFLEVTGTGEGDPLTDGYSDYGSLGSYTISGSISVANVNPVTANDDAVTVNEDSATKSIAVLANDTHDSGLALSIASVSATSDGGTATIVDGTFVDYRPAADFFGVETFSYTTTDGSGNQDTAVVTISVDAVNDAPTAVDDSFSVVSGSSSTLQVLANDTSAPDSGETLSITNLSTGSHGGSLSISGGTAIDYSPASGFIGQETFTYTISDGTSGSTDTATVIVDVEAAAVELVNFNNYDVNPYAGSQDVNATATILDEGSTLQLTGNGWKQIQVPYEVTTDTILQFDFRSSKEGEVHAIGLDTNLSLSSDLAFKVYGTQTWGIADFDDYSASDPEWTRYTIPVGKYYRGGFAYLFFANDHDVASPDAESYISNVAIYQDGAAVNTAPIANADAFSATEDGGALLLDVLSDDISDTGETLKITSVTAGSQGGSVKINGGKVEYQPAPDFNGDETFTYTINDGTLGHDSTATVTVSVASVSDVVDDTATTTDSASVTIDVLANDTFSGNVMIDSVSPAGHGEVTINADGTLSYVPVAGFTGDDSFTYTASSSGGLETATVSVVVSDGSSRSALNFNDFTVSTYGGSQDINASVSVEDNGSTLHLSGNGWKRIDLPYQVTSSTVLEFDFRSPSQGEIHGIGLDNDLAISSGQTFQLFGTQSWGRSGYNDYAAAAPEWIHYQIPIGQLYTGNFSYLFFVNDDDVASPQAESYFANVTMYESDTAATSPLASNDQFAVSSGSTGNQLDVLANDTTDSSSSLTIQSVTSGSAGGRVSVGDGTAIFYSPAAGFVGEETFTYTAYDAATGNTDSAVVSVTVDEVATINFNEYVVGSYAGTNQDVAATATIEDGGATLRLAGNGWKQIVFPYDVTATTVLQFDFRSSSQGEIHGIGLDNDLALSDTRTFSLYGTQTWGLSDFKDYAAAAPDWVRYQIPVGQFFTGSFSYLYFANDHDVADPTAESYFRNVALYEPASAGDSEAFITPKHTSNRINSPRPNWKQPAQYEEQHSRVAAFSGNGWLHQTDVAKATDEFFQSVGELAESRNDLESSAGRVRDVVTNLAEGLHTRIGKVL